ncbi:hypothetical protein FRC12_006350 [Ceratobasidium sp. 428]|nr:hypothetical protein FRC12_006350 [Ceratobasidium sp. 428]
MARYLAFLPLAAYLLATVYALDDGLYLISPGAPPVNPVSLELASPDGNVTLAPSKQSNPNQVWRISSAEAQRVTIKNVAQGSYAGSSNLTTGQNVQGVQEPFLFTVEPVEGGLYRIQVPDQDLEVSVANTSKPGTPAVFQSEGSSRPFRFDRLS